VLSGLTVASLAAVGSMTEATVAETPIAIADPDTAAKIVLPDRRVCRYVGPEPRTRDLGDPVTYDCGDGQGLRGEVRIDGVYMTVDREGPENRDRDAIIESQDVRFLIEEIKLVDGTVGKFAGEGATLAFDGKRLNYTCDNPSVGLIGDIESQAGGVFRIAQAKLDGTELAASEMMTIRRFGAIK
ncbi:MAG: hypothetical protein AAF622_05940, partial [Cyanobacteria bacterium P01_C01_bin.147]